MEASQMTPEEQLIQRYFDAFNRHDIEGVMACFHEEPALVHGDGKRLAGRPQVRRQYETEFEACPDGRCELRLCTGNSGRGVAESLFHGTRARDGKLIEAIGAEVMEIVGGKIKEIRDYHQPLPAKAA
jgi:ketosteroid isomerase-like protein